MNEKKEKAFELNCKIWNLKTHKLSIEQIDKLLKVLKEIESDK